MEACVFLNGKVIAKFPTELEAVHFCYGLRYSGEPLNDIPCCDGNCCEENDCDGKYHEWQYTGHNQWERQRTAARIEGNRVVEKDLMFIGFGDRT